jgi:hypothetical protein
VTLQNARCNDKNIHGEKFNRNLSLPIPLAGAITILRNVAKDTFTDTSSLPRRRESSRQLLTNVAAKPSIIPFSMEVKALNKLKITVTQVSMRTANSKVCVLT